MYETRFVYQLPLASAGEVGSHVADVVQATGHGPSNVNITADETLAVITVTYSTAGIAESNKLIDCWRKSNNQVQVERNHKINPAKFRNIALSGTDNGQLRNLLANEVERMCRKGVSSKGVLDYLQECEGILAEVRSYVESVRAPH